MLNRVFLIGRLGSNPELRYTPGGTPVASFRIATDRRWKDKNSGELKSETEWHNIVIMGKQAEIAGTYLKKGSLVFIEGRIRTRSWDDKNGNRHFTTEIFALNFRMLDKKEVAEVPNEEVAEEPIEHEPEADIPPTSAEDDIPF